MMGDGDDVSCDDGLDQWNQQGTKMVTEQENGLGLMDDGEDVPWDDDLNLQN